MQRATHLIRIVLIRMLIVACGMSSHSYSMAAQSCWILAGTGTRCRTRRSRASQTCSTGEAMDELGQFQLPRILYRSLRHGAVHYHAETRWRQMNGTPMGLRISSQYLCIQIAIDKIQLCRCP